MAHALAHHNPWHGGHAAIGAGLGLVGAVVGLSLLGMGRSPAVQGGIALAMVTGGAAALAPVGQRTGAAIGGAIGFSIISAIAYIPAVRERLGTKGDPILPTFGVASVGAPMLGAWLGATIQA